MKFSGWHGTGCASVSLDRHNARHHADSFGASKNAWLVMLKTASKERNVKKISQPSP